MAINSYYSKGFCNVHIKHEHTASTHPPVQCLINQCKCQQHISIFTFSPASPGSPLSPALPGSPCQKTVTGFSIQC